MKWDKFGYIIDSTSFDRMCLHTTQSRIHLKNPIKPEHRAICDFNIRDFITKDIHQVTCDECIEKTKK